MQFADASQPALTKGSEVKFNASDTLLAATTDSDAAAIGVIYQANAAGRPASATTPSSPRTSTASSAVTHPTRTPRRRAASSALS